MIKTITLQNFRFTKNLVDNKLSKEICIELTNKNNKSKKFYTKNEKIFIELSKHDFKKKYDIKNDKEILEKIFLFKNFLTTSVLKNINLQIKFLELIVRNIK